MRSIDSFIHRRPIVLNEETPARIAAKTMRENQVGCILVSDAAGRLAGIVTDRDFACRWAADYPATDVPISRIMTADVVTADENAGIQDIIGLMETHGIRRVPVVGTTPRGQERVVGIITLDDLLAAGSLAPRHLAQIVRRQIGRRLALPAPAPRTARSERRSDARIHQTLDRFHSEISKKTGLSPELTAEVTQFLLGALLMRVTATAATHFVAQLPKLIQEPLLRLPSGPDRHITRQYLLGELVSRFHITEDFAPGVLSQFLAALGEAVDPGEVRHLKCQLPQDLQALFPAEPSQAA